MSSFLFACAVNLAYCLLHHKVTGSRNVFATLVHSLPLYTSYHKSIKDVKLYLEARVGFEPTDRYHYRPPLFKSGAISHSTTTP